MSEESGMIGTKLSDRYEITGELGRGGMGVVFRAWDPVLDREVAVKLIPPTHVSPESEERFEREAKLVAQMDHPAIVPIYDFGRHGESLFLVMPVVPGTSLRPFLRDKSLLLGDVVDLGIQVADALAYSHAREVIHRDIKPENIMISREETGETRIRVMDFGLARMSTKTRITQTGMLVGTMGYVSPEQVLSKETDHRSDLYSLGTVLYESLVGSSPFSGEVQSILYRIVHEAPQPPTALGVDIDPELEEIVLSCLAKDPARRPQTAKELSDSLRGYLARLRDSDRRRSVMVSSTGQIPRTTLAPFVGREKELTELQQRLNAAIAGECQFVIVGGEPGSGKTRLLDELENLAKARSIRVLHGRFVEQDRSFPYQGFCEVIQEYFRQKETSTASSGLPDFSDVASELVSLFPMLSEITEFRSSSSAGTDRATPRPEDRTQIFELLARTLTKMAGGKSLLLLLEDLHDAEVSLEALQYIVRRLGPTPTLIVGTYRTLDVDRRHPLTKMLAGFHGDRKHASLTLGPFSPSEHRRFLETLIGGPELASDLVEKLYEGAEGNPFFTKELVRSLLDSGAIDQDDTGSWSLTGEAAITTDELPATIQQAVENRIERLPEELRDILSVAAVIGRSFDYRDLEALTGDGDVDDAVDRLVQEGLIEEDRKSRGDRLSFCSGVVRDVLYAQLSRRKRRVLHRRCGEQIEKRQSGKLERVYPELLYHFSEGDEPEKSVEYGLQLARKSLDRFTPEDGVRAAKTALEFLDEEWEGEGSTEGEVRLVLAQAHRMAGDIDAALNQADTAIRIFEREHQETRVVDALVFAAETAWQARRPAETSRWVERGTKAARAADRRASLRELLSLGATLANLRGEYENANELLREVEQLGEAARESAPSDEITEGGELVVAMANPVEARDPAFIEVVEATEVLSNVFETLVATDEQGSLVPALCERWQGVDDGRRFLLSLRPGVHFQDGHPLTAESVKASFERTIRHVTRETPAAYAAIVGVEAFLRGDSSEVAGLVVRSERELEIQLREALQIYPAFLTDMYTGISRASPEDPAQVTGTGPFRIAERSGERVLLQRNERYWKGTRSVLDSIEFRTGMSASAIAEGYRSGQLDLARDLLPQDLESFLRDPRYREGFVETPQKNTYFILYNCRSGSCTQDPKLRHALSGVVRVHDLVWRTLGRFAQPAASLIPPGVLGHDPGRKRYPLTLDAARELLGSNGPIRLKASVHPVLQDRYGSLVDALLTLWAEVGVSVSIETGDMTSFLESWHNNDGIDVLLTRYVADYDDPDNFTHSLFHSGTGFLHSYFCSPESDRLLEEARTENRPNARQSLYRKFENSLIEAGVFLPLFHDIDYRIAGPSVRGLKLRSTPPYVNYAELAKAAEPMPATEVPQRTGGVIHVPTSGVVNSLEPSRVYRDDEVEVQPCLFETLTRRVEGERIVPSLAREFQIEKGGTVYRFRLRDEVRFHDGRRLSARDVRYSFERLLQRSEYRGLLSPVKGAKEVLDGKKSDLTGIEIHSSTDFTIELEKPVSFFPVLVSHPAAGIVPEGSEDFGGSWREGCVGTGPFRLLSFEPGKRLELERNPDYWRPGYPRSDQLIFSFGVSSKEILSGFKEGRYSVCADLFPDDVEALRRDSEFASGLRETPHFSTYYIAFNTKRGPLKEHSELRRRIAESIPVGQLIRQALGRMAIPASGLIPPGLLGHDHTRGPARGPSGPAEPLSTGQDLTVAVHPLFLGKYSALSRAVSDAIQSVGVKVQRTTKTMAEFLEVTDKATVDLVIGRWVGDYPDTDTFTHGVLHSREGFLGRLCGSPEIDALVEQGRAETAPAVRDRIYRQVEELVRKNALILPLFHEQVYRFGHPQVEGLSVSSLPPVVPYEELRIRS